MESQIADLLGGNVDTRHVIKIPVVLKADVGGSVEALRSSLDLLVLSDDEAICKIDVVYSGVGEVTSSDVAVAAVSRAKLVAFNVGCGANAQALARSSNVEICYYSVVYNVLDELSLKVKTMLAPPPPGLLVGRAEIQQIFKIGKIGKIAGCSVTEGKMMRQSEVRIMRGKRNPIFMGSLSSLKVGKSNVLEVPDKSDCGLSFTNFQDFEEGDVIECYMRSTALDESE